MKKQKSSLKYFFYLLKPYKKEFFATIILVIIAAIGVINGPKIFGETTTLLLSGFSLNSNNELVINVDFNAINHKLMILSLIYLVVTISNYLRDLLMGIVASKVVYDVRVSINKKINRIPISYLDMQKDGDIISTVVNDANTLFDTLTQVLASGIYSFILVIGFLYMMFSISFELTLIPILSVPIIVIMGGSIMMFSKKYFRQTQDGLAKLNVHAEEMFSNHAVMQSFNGQKKSIEEFNEINESLVSSAQKGQFLSALLFPITAFVNNIAYVFAVIFGAKTVIDGKLNIGELQSFIQYMQQFTNPLQQISQFGQFIQQSAAASERIVKLLEAPEMEEKDEYAQVENVEGNITFENVYFEYEKDVPIIKNFSLDVKAGSKVAIVGKTGAGKTTLINLLMRFYEVNKGRILLDGVDMKDISKEEISNTFSMVLQDTWLFNGTIYENIAYGNEFTSKEEVEMAAKFANADHFIKTMPGGYNMMINEESSNISQGQKQLLTIARAFLGNKKILILDEATSSVDTRTEKLIQGAMNKLMYGKTSFIIAHRLSTIKNADIILVMDQGNIVEKGNHQELLQLNGRYASLYHSQFESVE